MQSKLSDELEEEIEGSPADPKSRLSHQVDDDSDFIMT